MGGDGGGDGEELFGGVSGFENYMMRNKKS